jgi:Arc/MetJ-type ribon-helix-helix transcriptional regulator
MPSESEGFRGVSLKAEVVSEIEKFIEENPTYRSVAEFVSEAVRLRMEQVRKGRGKGARA